MPCARGCCPDQRSHFRSVSFADSGELVRVNAGDRKVARDMAAYRELIRQGYEPHCMTGAYELARDARSAAEIEGRPDDFDF